jgi:hypothetical protein
VVPRSRNARPARSNDQAIDLFHPRRIDDRPLTSDELLQLDAADSRTKRGGKLERDRNSAKSQAKVWLIFFFLCTIFWISLRVSDSTKNPECEAMGSCDCLDFFDAIYTAHVLLMFFYSAFRVRIGCESSKVRMNRRELKILSR